MRTRSPSFRRARLIFSPLTNVPLVEPRSSIQICSPCIAMRACLRETMSSTRTMSRSLERPTRICLSVAIGNSPPWYLPLMKRKTYERASVRGAIDVGALGDGSCISRPTETSRAMGYEEEKGLYERRGSRRNREAGAGYEQATTYRAACPTAAATTALKSEQKKGNGCEAERSSRGGFMGAELAPPARPAAPVAGGGDAYGTHRGLEPPRALPQQAWRVDNDFTRLFQGETLVGVETLNLDAASFVADGGGRARGGRDRRRRRRRGGCTHRLTNHHRPRQAAQPGHRLGGDAPRAGPSGGRRGAATSLRVGDRIASLVSLSLTPLRVDAVRAVRRASAQIDVDGEAVLFASGACARLPHDLPERVALAALDVAGAAPQVARLVVPGSRGRGPRRRRQERRALRRRGASSRGTGRRRRRGRGQRRRGRESCGRSASATPWCRSTRATPSRCAGRSSKRRTGAKPT